MLRRALIAAGVFAVAAFAFAVTGPAAMAHKRIPQWIPFQQMGGAPHGPGPQLKAKPKTNTAPSAPRLRQK